MSQNSLEKEALNKILKNFSKHLFYGLYEDVSTS